MTSHKTMRELVLWGRLCSSREAWGSSDASKVAFGEKTIVLSCVRTMTNKKQRQEVRKRVERCNQTLSKEQITEKLKDLARHLRMDLSN